MVIYLEHKDNGVMPIYAEAKAKSLEGKGWVRLKSIPKKPVKKQAKTEDKKKVGLGDDLSQTKNL